MGEDIIDFAISCARNTPKQWREGILNKTHSHVPALGLRFFRSYTEKALTGLL